MRRADTASSAGPPAASATEDRPRIGRYEVIERIGLGGMAEAFRAKARGPGGYERDLVIKRILPENAEDPRFVQMFVEEAKILGMLHHPNIVQIYDFGEDDGRHFLALEYIDGPSMATIIATLRRDGQRMSPIFAAYVAHQVCEGLSAVHGLADPQGKPLGIVHRDVTPSNIMTMTAGGVKLLDFGVAKIGAMGTVTKAGDVRGKPAYLAPEQLKGKPLDGRVDLFSLGIVLHEMLTLEHLFSDDESDFATVYKVMNLKIPPPSAIRKDVPARLDRIVMRALERDRRRRYQTAADMGSDLEEIVLTSQVRVEEVAAFVNEMNARRTVRRPSDLPSGNGSRPSGNGSRRARG